MLGLQKATRKKTFTVTYSDSTTCGNVVFVAVLCFIQAVFYI